MTGSPLFGIRAKDGDTDPYSILAGVGISSDGEEGESVINQTIHASIAVGPFLREALFVTRDFRLAASLVLTGQAHDFKEVFSLHDFATPFTCSGGTEVEVFDILTGLGVAVSIGDPELEGLVRIDDMPVGH